MSQTNPERAYPTNGLKSQVLRYYKVLMLTISRMTTVTMVANIVDID
jgi:hypothetical protein